VFIFFLFSRPQSIKNWSWSVCCRRNDTSTDI